MSMPSKSMFVSIFIVITLLGMSLSAMPNNENKELEEEQTKFFSHSNVNFAGYQEDSVYSYSTLSSGGYSQCVITEDERVVCWGSNENGKRGLGGGIGGEETTPYNRAVPWLVQNLAGGMVEVSTGGWSTCSLEDTGQIWCWGGGQYGQLGTAIDVCQDDGSTTCNMYTNHPPSTILLPSGKTAVSLSDANQGHYCAILDTGEGLCWGYNEHGELGDGTVCTGGNWQSGSSNPTPAGCNANNGRYIPQIVDDSNFPTNSSFISISTGFHHTCGIIDNNDLYCWGRNDDGQLGIGSIADVNYPLPQLVDSNVIAVGTGDDHTCALYQSQIVKCWGANYDSQLGTGNNFWYNEPTTINLSTNIPIISLEVAYKNTCAISEELVPYCWGANWWGQTGNGGGDNTHQSNPLAIGVNTALIDFGERPNVIATSINGNTLCIIHAGQNNSSHSLGDVVCGGQAYRGQMGDGNWNNSWSDVNLSHVNLSSDYIGPSSYYGAGGIHISERDIDSDSVIGILDNLPNGCPDGSFDPYYDGSCVTSDAGYFSTNIMYHSQNPCDLGTYQPNSGQSSCIDSSPGHFVDATASLSQQNCQSGTYQPNAGQSSCIDASPGHEINLDSTSQELCSVGYYQPDFGQQNCIPSSPGYSVANLGSSTQDGCDPGTYQPNFASSSCIEASLGHYVENENATAQLSCTPGTYQPNYASTSCLTAEPGHWVENYGSSQTQSCPLGTYGTSLGAIGIETCISADPGYYVDSTGASIQLECIAGTYNPVIGAISSADCLAADAGNYVGSSGSSEQTPCDLGTYQPNSGQIFCLESSSGTYVSNTGSSSVSDCLEGTYQPNSGQSECIDTSPGYFTSSVRASVQTPCLAGSYQPNSGSVTCLQADAGYHVPIEGQNMQTICPAGQYQPQPSSTECLITNPGEYSSEGSTSPSPCLAGSYQSDSGQSGCILADAGYYSSEISSIEQTSCQPGEYQPLTGQSSCISAARGHYVDSTAATEETPCDVGSYQPFMSSTECMLASTNNFVGSPGMASQTVCPSGESQPLTGQSSCNVNPEDSGIPTFALIGGVAAVALVIMGVLMRPGSKPQAKKSGKKRRKMKKK